MSRVGLSIEYCRYKTYKQLNFSCLFYIHMFVPDPFISIQPQVSPPKLS
jgi:hypothetical protein